MKSKIVISIISAAIISSIAIFGVSEYVLAGDADSNILIDDVAIAHPWDFKIQRGQTITIPIQVHAHSANSNDLNLYVTENMYHGIPDHLIVDENGNMIENDIYDQRNQFQKGLNAYLSTEFIQGELGVDGEDRFYTVNLTIQTDKDAVPGERGLGLGVSVSGSKSGHINIMPVTILE